MALAFQQIPGVPTALQNDLDMESFFDFGNTTTGAAASASENDYLFDAPTDDTPMFTGPSHDYDLFEQQTFMPQDNYWADIDTDMVFSEPQPAPTRLYPGMHSQQAMAKSQAMAAQMQAQSEAQMQAQMQAQAQVQAQAQMQAQAQAQVAQVQAQAQARAKSLSMTPIEMDKGEENISRIINKMRQLPAVKEESSSAARMKKEDDELDEDERLLASEEGKKLTSKERRQLRNKVSARAFRSRRKEYITQLEGEVAAKSQECELLREEQARTNAMLQKLLHHPALVPYLTELQLEP